MSAFAGDIPPAIDQHETLIGISYNLRYMPVGKVRKLMEKQRLKLNGNDTSPHKHFQCRGFGVNVLKCSSPLENVEKNRKLKIKHQPKETENMKNGKHTENLSHEKSVSSLKQKTIG